MATVGGGRAEGESTSQSNPATNSAPRRQGVYWFLTIPHRNFVPYLPPGVIWIKGQLERGGGEGNEEGFLHWQVVCTLGSKQSLHGITRIFGSELHAELTKWQSAEDYVWKQDTSIANTRFELGIKPFNRNSEVDWSRVWDLAAEGKLLDIPASIRVPHYRTLRTIAQDFMEPIAMERSVSVFWGRTGTGKSKKAWEEAGALAYPKAPTTKFWCGYRGQKNVVIDEFRGAIDISHLLRWLDRYPVNVETKGSGGVYCAERIWITSNLAPSDWYPHLDEETRSALMRRLNVIVEF